MLILLYDLTNGYIIHHLKNAKSFKMHGIGWLEIHHIPKGRAAHFSRFLIATR